MKKFILLASVALCLSIFVSCQKDNKGQLDPNAMISIRPAAGVPSGKAETNPEHWSAERIVREVNGIYFQNNILDPGATYSRGFGPQQRDLENMRLLMFGTDIIDQGGYYVSSFIEGENVLLVYIIPSVIAPLIDTVAYVPNSVLRKTQVEIKAAYDAGDYTTCYSLFDKAFTFIPITGAEWLALKAKGEN